MTPAVGQAAAGWLSEGLETRLEEASAGWLASAVEKSAAGLRGAEFGALLSLASRYLPERPLAPAAEALERAGALLAGWNPERWSLREAGRVRLLLARPDLAGEDFSPELEELFHYADEGEMRALYKALALFPEPERFRWRAAEGCRTNIVPVFESVACDTPFPAAHFDDVAWNQMVIKALFVGAPLWRVRGLDSRLSEELARMALDLADERRSAGRVVPHELWLALGPHGGERALASLEQELHEGDERSRRAADLALARARTEGDFGPDCDQTTFRELDPREE